MIKVVTGKIRMSYVNLFNPRAMAEGEEAKYSLRVLIPKSDKETINKINSAVEAAKKADASLLEGSTSESLKTPLRDGDLERPDREEYKGHYFINAVSRRKPKCVDKYLREIHEEAELYSGCLGKVSISFYAFNKGGSSGVGCGLLNVQKLEDGQVIDGISSPEEDFKVEGGDAPW